MIYSSFDDAIDDMDPNIRSFYLFLLGAYAQSETLEGGKVIEFDIIGLSEQTQISRERYMQWFDELAQTVVTKVMEEGVMHVPLLIVAYAVYPTGEVGEVPGRMGVVPAHLSM